MARIRFGETSSSDYYGGAAAAAAAAVTDPQAIAAQKAAVLAIKAADAVRAKTISDSTAAANLSARGKEKASLAVKSMVGMASKFEASRLKTAAIRTATIPAAEVPSSASATSAGVSSMSTQTKVLLATGAIGVGLAIWAMVRRS